jgi:hypothetical protein
MIAGRAVSDNGGYPYKPDDVLALRRTLSDDRFERYLQATNGDEVAALQRYAWNTAVASAFYAPLQTCEVALRNSVHQRLSKAYGAWWLHNATLLKGEELRMASEAELTVERRGKEVTSGRVVAELGFAFWVSLFSKSYDEILWRTHLYRDFRPRPNRNELHGDLDRLRTLRNRIAHHEPLFQRSLLDDYHRLLGIVRNLSPAVAEWVEYHSRVYDVLAAAPHEVGRF